MTKPRQIKIIGKEKSLDEVIEGVIVLDEIIEKNKHNYRQAWKTWLPTNKGKDRLGRMAYVPVVCMRKAYSEIAEQNSKEPYFIFILNQGRDERPKSAKKHSKKAKKKSHCKLCKNILKKGMIISEIDDYYLTPNGYPYHNCASLLIHKSKKRDQKSEIRPEEIATWIKTSILLNQYLFYNSLHAGASIIEHQHIQMVDPMEMKMDHKIISYPIFEDSIVKRQRVNEKSDVFRLTNYPVDALVFTGRDSPHKAVYATRILRGMNAAYNILVNKDEVLVVGRNKNPDRETSICMRRKVGGYEITGVALLGDIEERFGKTQIKIHGAKLFSNMSYDIVRKNIAGATIPLDSVAKHF